MRFFVGFHALIMSLLLQNITLNTFNWRIIMAQAPNVVAQDLQRDNRRRAAENAAVQQAAEQAAKQQGRSSAWQQVVKILRDCDLAKNPQNRQAVLDLKRNYSENESLYLASTMGLFAKKNLLSQQSFDFLKSSMNIITLVFKLFSALSDVGLFNGENLKKYMDIKALDELNALFGLLSADEDGNLTQSRFDEVLETVTPVTETFVKGVSEDPSASGVAHALVDCVEQHIDSEAVLQAVKEHPAPKKAAEAVLKMKDKGMSILPESVKEVLAADDPVKMVEALVGGIQRDLAKPAEESSLRSAAQGIASMFGFFSQSPEPAATQPQPEATTSQQAASMPADVERLDDEAVTAGPSR